MLSRDQLDLIPDSLLNARTTDGLLEWLHARGWAMSLMELDSERRLRKTLTAVGARQVRHLAADPSSQPRRGTTKHAPRNHLTQEERTSMDTPEGLVETAARRGDSDFPKRWGTPVGDRFSEERRAWIEKNIALDDRDPEVQRARAHRAQTRRAEALKTVASEGHRHGRSAQAALARATALQDL